MSSADLVVQGGERIYKKVEVSDNANNANWLMIMSNFSMASTVLIRTSNLNMIFSEASSFLPITTTSLQLQLNTLSGPLFRQPHGRHRANIFYRNVLHKHNMIQAFCCCFCFSKNQSNAANNKSQRRICGAALRASMPPNYYCEQA